MIVLIFMALLTCGGGQIPPAVENTWILRNVIDTLDNLSLQLKEFQEKVEAKFEEVQANVTGIIETQKTIIQADIKRYSGGGFTCQDVDECSLNTDDCSEEKICINNPGSYECKKCPRFFKKEGDICQGPVCESSPTSLFVQEIGCLTWVRKLMRWDEAKSKCQEMGLRLAEGLQRRHFQALSDHFYPLITSHYGPWIGLRHRQWLNQEEEGEIQEEDWYGGQPDGDLDECGYIFLHPSTPGFEDVPCLWYRYTLCQSLP